MAVEFCNRRLAASVLSALSAHVHTARVHKATSLRLLEAFEARTRSVILQKTFAVWRERHQTLIRVRRLEDVALCHYNTRVQRTCMRQWVHQLACVQKETKLIAAADAFRSNQLQVFAFYSWRRMMRTKALEASKTSIALWLWSAHLQRRVLRHWLGHSRDARKHRARVQQALLDRRHRLQCEGFRRWRSVAGLDASSVASTSQVVLLRVRRYAMRWLQKTVMHRQQRHRQLRLQTGGRSVLAEASCALHPSRPPPIGTHDSDSGIRAHQGNLDVRSSHRRQPRCLDVALLGESFQARRMLHKQPTATRDPHACAEPAGTTASVIADTQDSVVLPASPRRAPRRAAAVHDHPRVVEQAQHDGNTNSLGGHHGTASTVRGNDCSSDRDAACADAMTSDSHPHQSHAPPIKTPDVLLPVDDGQPPLQEGAPGRKSRQHPRVPEFLARPQPAPTSLPAGTRNHASVQARGTVDARDGSSTEGAPMTPPMSHADPPPPSTARSTRPPVPPVTPTPPEDNGSPTETALDPVHSAQQAHYAMLKQRRLEEIRETLLSFRQLQMRLRNVREQQVGIGISECDGTHAADTAQSALEHACVSATAKSNVDLTAEADRQQRLAMEATVLEQEIADRRALLELVQHELAFIFQSVAQNHGSSPANVNKESEVV
eukprot:m.1448205 g.1448205  ORF g.1448205 m.1448205 type:complete len:662 (-) comp25112_c0_seq3:1912-3897(-)